MELLRRDVRGDTLPVMAVAPIPICGLMGSRIDTPRLYAVKARLQQACDAGVIAGGKFMNDNQAVSFTPVEANGAEVNSTAKCTVPVTFKKMFGATYVTRDVTYTLCRDIAAPGILLTSATSAPSRVCREALQLPPPCHDSLRNTISAAAR